MNIVLHAGVGVCMMGETRKVAVYHVRYHTLSNCADVGVGMSGEARQSVLSALAHLVKLCRCRCGDVETNQEGSCVSRALTPCQTVQVWVM